APRAHTTTTTASQVRMAGHPIIATAAGAHFMWQSAVQVKDSTTSSHCSPAAALTTPSPHSAFEQSTSQVLLSPPSSHCSPASVTWLPHVALISTVRDRACARSVVVPRRRSWPRGRPPVLAYAHTENT